MRNGAFIAYSGRLIGEMDPTIPIQINCSLMFFQTGNWGSPKVFVYYIQTLKHRSTQVITAGNGVSRFLLDSLLYHI